MKIVVDVKRVQEEIPADTVLDAMDGTNPRAVLNMLGHFVHDDEGNLLPYEQGRKELGKQTFAQIGELVKDFRRVTEDILVPPTNARD